MTAPITSNDNASGKGSDNENFPVGSFLIRADLRPHVHAFYNFAREADDISDHPTMDAPEKIARLDKFAATLLDDKNDEIPSAAALRKSLRQTDISPQHALDLLTAFKRDVTQLRYRDWHDLMDYCNFSANPVGRYVLALHGVGKEAWSANDALCSALQVINHLQDCADDYRELDRVYLPQDLMDKFGITTDDLSHEKSTPGLRAVLDALLDKLDPLLKDARKLPPQIPDFRLKAETAIIGALAEQLTGILRKRDPLCDKVKPSKTAAFCAVLKGITRTCL